MTDKGQSPGWDPTRPESREYSQNLERQAEELFRSRSSAEWLELLEEQNIPAGPIRFIEEMYDDPQVVANGLSDEFEHSQEGRVRMVGPYARFSGTKLGHAPPSPSLGEHTGEILEWLGYTETEVHGLRQDGIVG